MTIIQHKTRSQGLVEFSTMSYWSTRNAACLSSNGLSSACKETRRIKGAGDGARTRRSACLEGRCSQKRRLLDTNSLYRLFEECFLVLALAWQKLLHASFQPIGKSVHLQAPSGSHEVSSSPRVYLIDVQKGMGQDKKTKTWTRVSSPKKKP